MILVGFSSPMGRSSLAAGGFSVVDSAGAAVGGTLHLDRDVLSFAPSAPLTQGATYTIQVSIAATNLAGISIAEPFTSSFTVESSAPATAPTLDPITAACDAPITVTGGAPAGSRVRLDSGSLTLFTTANLSGRYTFNLPSPGRSGYQLVRVRIAGGDGSLSPAAAQCVLLSCEGTRVSSATFDRAANALTISFTAPIDASTAAVGASGTIHLTLADGRSLGGTVTPSSDTSLVVTPAEDLGAASFTLEITTGIEDAAGNALAAPFTRTFAVSGEEPVPGDGEGLLSGQILNATTGRPLPNAQVEVTHPVSAYTDNPEDHQ